ncbi:transcription activator for actt3 gene [Colletotrichum incanum]|uniref:Transcription activator for actt3 protein n=1 Tax=Colletotrichum incanum TaxID=1573173 RepID=A0A167D1E1_COLIC|nr:transcription activator for actt3 gene [Colletotrichum incanum]
MASSPISPCRINANTRRLRNSCDFCTQSKLKCDQGKPSCNRCLRRQQECIYSRVKKSGRPSKGRSRHESSSWETRSTDDGIRPMPLVLSPRDTVLDSIDCTRDVTATQLSKDQTPPLSAGDIREVEDIECFGRGASQRGLALESCSAHHDIDILLEGNLDLDSHLDDIAFDIDDMFTLNTARPRTLQPLNTNEALPDPPIEKHGSTAGTDSTQNLADSCSTRSFRADVAREIGSHNTRQPSWGSNSETENFGHEPELDRHDKCFDTSTTTSAESQESGNHRSRPRSIRSTESAFPTPNKSLCRCFSSVSRLHMSMQSSTQPDELVPLDLLLHIEDSIDQAQEIIQNCRDCRPQSSHLMVMLCTVIDWVVENLTKTLSGGVSSGGSSQSYKQASSMLQVGRSTLQDDVWNTCMYELLKNRLRRITRIVNGMSRIASKEPDNESVYFDPNSMSKALRIMGYGIRYKLEYLLGMIELWVS